MVLLPLEPLPELFDLALTLALVLILTLAITLTLALTLTFTVSLTLAVTLTLTVTLALVVTAFILTLSLALSGPSLVSPIVVVLFFVIRILSPDALAFWLLPVVAALGTGTGLVGWHTGLGAGTSGRHSTLVGHHALTRRGALGGGSALVRRSTQGGGGTLDGGSAGCTAQRGGRG